MLFLYSLVILSPIPTSVCSVCFILWSLRFSLFVDPASSKTTQWVVAVFAVVLAGIIWLNFTSFTSLVVFHSLYFAGRLLLFLMVFFHCLYFLSCRMSTLGVNKRVYEQDCIHSYLGRGWVGIFQLLFKSCALPLPPNCCPYPWSSTPIAATIPITPTSTAFYANSSTLLFLGPIVLHPHC